MSWLPTKRAPSSKTCLWRPSSWDLLVRPKHVFHSINDWLNNPGLHQTSAGFPLLFALFLLMTYLMLYALTHLQHMQPAPAQLKPSAT